MNHKMFLLCGFLPKRLVFSWVITQTYYCGWFDPSSHKHTTADGSIHPHTNLLLRMARSILTQTYYCGWFDPSSHKHTAADGSIHPHKNVLQRWFDPSSHKHTTAESSNHPHTNILQRMVRSILTKPSHCIIKLVHTVLYKKTLIYYKIFLI